MTKGWQLVGTALATALSVAAIAPDAVRGSVWSWALIVLVLAVPVGAASEVRDLRRRGQHDIADALVRWTFGLAATVMGVLWINQARINEVYTADDPTRL